MFKTIHHGITCLGLLLLLDLLLCLLHSHNILFGSVLEVSWIFTRETTVSYVVS